MGRKSSLPPPKPPPGNPEWIEKGFIPYENPNWWQRIFNKIFVGEY